MTGAFDQGGKTLAFGVVLDNDDGCNLKIYIFINTYQQFKKV